MPALREETVPVHVHLEAQRRGLLLVALDDRAAAVGFALTRLFASDLYLVEIDVHPRCQGRGIGNRLLDRVQSLADEHACRAVSLVTFSRVRCNAPWYRRHGFRAVAAADMPPYLKAILERDAERGLDLQRRVAMRKVLCRTSGKR